MPKVKVVESGKAGEYELELSDDPDDSLTISVEKVPVFVSFSQLGNFAVVDPSIEEELCMGCRTTIGVNKAGNICAIDKGTGAISVTSLPELTLVATKIGTKIIAELDEKLEAEKEGTTIKTGFSKAL